MTMKKNILTILVVFPATMILLSSCYTYGGGTIVSEDRQKENLYYIPSAPNTQLLTEKNDFALGGSSSAGTKFSGGQGQVAYMAGTHIGLIGSYFYAKGNGDNFKYHSLEGGLGYVTNLSKEWHFESYAGIGNGKINNFHATGVSTIKQVHYFIQPAIAVTNAKRTAQFAFVSKFSGVHSRVDTSFNTSFEPFSTRQVTALYEKPFQVMWEPGIEFRVGWKNFLFHTGFSLSADLTNPDLHKANNIFSIGGSLRFNTSSGKNK
jgi:hypothetical protein